MIPHFFQCASTSLFRNSITILRNHEGKRFIATKENELKFQDKPLSRTNIGIFGAMNVGKSSLMNLVTAQQTSIVDAKPGTTADTKIAFMEMHKLGPVKLFDTPGVDESGLLGEKKREKVWISVKESDIAIIIIDPRREVSVEAAERILAQIRRRAESPQVLIVYNLFENYTYETDQFNNLTEQIENRLGLNDPTNKINYESLALNLHSPTSQKRLIRFVEEKCEKHDNKAPLLPQNVTFDENSYVLFNIPMDAETPSGRLLRPQAIMQEAFLRNYVSTVCYRMDLAKARHKDPQVRAIEEKRFRQLLDALKSTQNFKLLVTDSQAIDIVHPWTLDENGQEIVAITTFSVAMINYMSGGRLAHFVEGLEKFRTLRRGDKVLICEACNHNRILDDIGTVQIPRKINQRFGEGAIGIDHAFGREYQTRNLADYDMVIHCGGCMIDQQKMVSRIEDIGESGIPITNYGVLLSMLQSERALARVLRPFGIEFKEQQQQRQQKLNLPEL